MLFAPLLLPECAQGMSVAWRSYNGLLASSAFVFACGCCALAFGVVASLLGVAVLELGVAAFGEVVVAFGSVLEVAPVCGEVVVVVDVVLVVVLLVAPCCALCCVELVDAPGVAGVWLVTGGVVCCGVVLPGMLSCCCSMAMVCGRACGSAASGVPFGVDWSPLGDVLIEWFALQVLAISRRFVTCTWLVVLAVVEPPCALLSLVWSWRVVSSTSCPTLACSWLSVPATEYCVPFWSVIV